MNKQFKKDELQTVKEGEKKQTWIIKEMQIETKKSFLLHHRQEYKLVRPIWKPFWQYPSIC